MKNKRGFSLIELIGVIVTNYIMSILFLIKK